MNNEAVSLMRKVVVLRQVDGLRHKEIAERLGFDCSATSESLYASGLAHLRKPENYEFAALVEILRNKT